jgi:hypothetical protein
MRHFNIHRNDSVPSRNTVLLWVRNFRETASAVKRKPPGISQVQGVRKETKDKGGLETDHQGRIGSNSSNHAATSDAELPETLAGMC